MDYNLFPLGQTKAWNSLTQQLDSLPQSMLLVGPNGVGKRTTVLALFQLLNCHNPIEQRPCGTCLSCKKIFEKNHVDIIEISPTNNQIVIDDLREMKKSLYFSPTESKKRFVIINDAHRLNNISANSLLKTLEEPPSHTNFFLITCDRSLILQTIQSRCHFLFFSPLGTETIHQILSKLNLSIPEDIKDIIMDFFAGGIANIELIKDTDIHEWLRKLSKLNIHSPIDQWSQIIQLSEEMSKDNKLIQFALDYMLHQIHKNVTTNYQVKYDSEQLHNILYLRNRLDQYANKKLMSLATSDVFYS